MKLLYVRGDDDYGALTFEQSEHANDLNKVWEDASKEPNGELEFNDGEFIVQALEFDVSGSEVKALLNFIQNQCMDYDGMKHTNFYVVKE